MKNKFVSMLIISILFIFLLSVLAISSKKSYASLDDVSTYQQAIIDVANAFYYRGNSLQYDDYSMTDNEILYSNRRSKHNHFPEEATNQDIQYTVCSELIFNVYYETFSDQDGNHYEIKDGEGNTVWFTSKLINLANRNSIYYNEKLAVDYISGSEGELSASSEEYGERIKNELEIGDIIVYRTKSYGHAMLYLGGDDVINSSSISNDLVGGSYNYNTKKDVYEEKGTVGYVSLNDDVLHYTDKYSKYIFGSKVISIAILRPLNEIIADDSDYSLTLNTVNRMKHNKLVRSKTSSNDKYDNVYLNDEITFTITLENKSNENYVDILVEEVIPENTTFVNATGGVKIQENNLTWTVTVPKNSSINVSYTVKVNDDKSLIGSKVVSDKTIVDGVNLNKIEYIINNKLSETKQNEIINLSNKQGTFYKTFKDLFDEIFPKIEFYSADELLNLLFIKELSTTNGSYGHSKIGETEIFRLRSDINNKKLSKMIVQCLYGGEYMVFENEISSGDIYDDGRNTFYDKDTFTIGDILLVYDADYLNDTYLQLKESLFIYLGNSSFATVIDNELKILDEETGSKLIESLMGQNCFITLRPSNIYYEFINETIKIDYNNNYILNILNNKTVNEISKTFRYGGDFKIISSNGIEKETSDIVVTGDKIVIYTNETNSDIYTLVVKGDVNGDGEVNTADAYIITRHSLSIKLLENEYFLAGDINNNGEVNTADAFKIVRYNLGKDTNL